MKIPFFIGYCLMSSIPSTAQNINCDKTPVPNLYENWKIDVLNENASEKETRDLADRFRPMVQQKFDPFTIIAYDTLKRKQRNETVVWEDDSVMVVLGIANKRKFLVVPKQPLNFIVDASPALRIKLAQVAAATSDAIRWALSAPCDSFASIYIHPPQSLGVRQLHIHVEPRYYFQSIGQSEFNEGVTEYLRKNFLLE